MLFSLPEDGGRRKKMEVWPVQPDAPARGSHGLHRLAPALRARSRDECEPASAHECVAGVRVP